MAQTEVFPVFLVEDSDDDLFLFRRLLAKAELTHPLTVATDGQAAIDLLGDLVRSNSALPGVVFVDLKLPLRSGFEVLEWMAVQPRLAQSCARLVLSSSAEARDVKRAYDLGANGYLVKYPSPAVFREVLRLAESIRSGVAADSLTFPGVARP